MDELAVVIVIGAAIFAAVLFRFLSTRRGKHQEEPIIELEKLVNCTACGSLVPEEVNRCAFCGAQQKKTN